MSVSVVPPPPDELEHWRTAISSTFVTLDAEPTGTQPFVGRVTTHPVGGLTVSRLAVAGQCVRRGQAELRRSQSEMVYLVRQLAGSSFVRMDDDLLAVEPGDFLLVDPNRTYELRFVGVCRQLCIQVPEPWLRARDIHDIEPAIGRRLDGRVAAARVLAAATDALMPRDEPDALEAADAAELFMDVLEHALLKLRRSESIRRPERRPEVAALSHFIDANYRTEGLSPVDAAAALGCSLRTVHNLSNTLGTTFSRQVTARRLDAAARELAQADGGVRVAEVAYRNGFSDVSQFCRSFRARFDVPARAYRAMAGRSS